MFAFLVKIKIDHHFGGKQWNHYISVMEIEAIRVVAFKVENSKWLAFLEKKIYFGKLKIFWENSFDTLWLEKFSMIYCSVVFPQICIGEKYFLLKIGLNRLLRQTAGWKFRLTISHGWDRSKLVFLHSCNLF